MQQIIRKEKFMLLYTRKYLPPFNSHLFWVKVGKFKTA